MNQRGSVFPEYVALLTLVAIGVTSASIALGPPFLEWYRTQRAVLLLPIPS
jgi:hypothetical protein